MREIKLSEIKKKCNTPEAMSKKKQIRMYVRSQPGFTPGRKRPKDPDEARILEGFKRK